MITGQGHWDFLDRAIDRDGHLIDARLRDTRDLAAAEAFLRSAWTVTGVAPDRISTDGHDAEPRAMRTVFGARVMHHPTCDLTNARERAHRGMKPRDRPLGGLDTCAAAVRCCRVCKAIRAGLRPWSRRYPPRSRMPRQDIPQDRLAPFMGRLAAASTTFGRSTAPVASSWRES